MALQNPNYGFGFGGYALGSYGNEPITSLPLAYYINLTTSEYRDKANHIAWLTALLRYLDDFSQVLEQFDSAFDLDYAQGVQLDTLGVIIGQSRVMNFQPSNGVSPILDDDTYRLLLKARIGYNQWDGTADGLQPVWQNLFPGGNIVVIDNQNMSATILMTGSFSSIIQDLIAHGLIVPRPAGVLYNYDFGVLPVFGFDRNDQFIAGFDTGHWSGFFEE
jgi:hypothetical protein